MNSWLDDEINKIKTEKMKKVRDTRDYWILLAFIIFISLGFCISPHCQAQPNSKWILFPSTWICKKCGYENYDGINTCAACGKRK